MDVLPRADYERHTRAMRALGEVHEDVIGDALSPHVSASVTATLPRDTPTDSLVPWVALGREPGAFTMVQGSEHCVSIHVQVRGELP